MKLGQVIGQVNWVDMELIASLFLLYRKNGGIISSSMSGFLEYCYWIFQILKINKFNKVLLSSLFHYYFRFRTPGYECGVPRMGASDALSVFLQMPGNNCSRTQCVRGSMQCGAIMAGNVR